jgi:hypothetical protein
MFAPIAVQDLSWQDPQFGGPDAILKWLECSKAYMNIPTATTNDLVEIGPVLNSTNIYQYIGSAISKNGLIAAAPFFANRILYINTLNDNVTTGSTDILYDYGTTVYCSYNDSFYLGGGNTQGILKNPANNTSSLEYFYTESLFTSLPWVDQNIIYAIEFLGNGIDSRLITFNVDTNTTSSLTRLSGSIISSTFLASNNIMFFQTPRNVIFYDLNTNTTGSCTGQHDADSIATFRLMPDNNYYSVPFFESDKVYKLDPITKTETEVYSGSPYVGGGSVRNRFIGSLPNNTIASWNNVLPYQDYAYDYSDNTVSSLPFTFLKGITDFAYGDCVMATNAMYLIPQDSQKVQKFNLVNYRNLLNSATFSSPINTILP